MANDITIADSNWGKLTQEITTMQDADSSLNKDLTATLQLMDTLNNAKAVFKVETNQAQKELEKAEKRFKYTGSAADKMAIQTASVNFDNVTKNLGNVTDNASNAEKKINDLVTTASKVDNRVGSLSESGLMKGLAISDLGKMAIETGLNVATTHVGSAYGSAAATVFNSMASGAVKGGTIGTAIAPGVGTAVGTVVGGTLGYINGENEVFQKQDNVYKAKVKSHYDSHKQEQSDDLTKGRQLSIEREDDQFEIKNLVGGSDIATLSIMSDVANLSSKIAIERNQLMGITKTILYYNNKANVKSMLTNLADTGAGLNMNGDEINDLTANLGMLSQKSVVSESDFAFLESSKIDVWKYLKAKYKVSNEEQLAEIGLTGKNVTSAILEGTKKDYKGKMDEKKKTISGKKIILSNLENESIEEKGEGFNQIESSNLDSQIKFRSDHAFEYGVANKKIGIAHGSLQLTNDSNFQNQMNNIFRGKTFDKQKYVNAVNSKDVSSGFIIEDMFALLKTKADNATESSNINQVKEASNLNLYTNIQIEVKQNDKNWMYGWKISQIDSKGRAANTPKGNSWSNPFSILLDDDLATIRSKENKFQGKATGIFRVPYNNFPALLHEGETVSTAVEARSARNTPSVTITGNSFVVREEADIDKIARAFVEKLTKVSAVAVAS